MLRAGEKGLGKISRDALDWKRDGVAARASPRRQQALLCTRVAFASKRGGGYGGDDHE